MKSISENKLKAFSIGRMNISKNSLSKQERLELKKKEDEKKTAEVYKDFVASFEGGKPLTKTFLRGDVINANEKTDLKKNRVYKPKSRFMTSPSQGTSGFLPTPSPKQTKPNRPTLKKKEDKKKSNLELFKEELRVLQMEREQRHTVKKNKMVTIIREEGATPARPSRFEPLDDKIAAKAVNNPSLLDDLVANSQNADPMTTNLFLGNVNPRMDEQQLCELFGKYGALASVKVMWPRTDEERQRERNCAFVAFMTRRDADRALRHLQGRDVMGFEMKLGWGKTVPIPPNPVYIPPTLRERTMPPPPSGLPFNAQPIDASKKSTSGIPPDFKDQQDFEETLKNSIVRVVVPTERNLLGLIHRMVEFVVREGPMFEAMIMNREMNNPMFRFLFDNKSPAHIYYRWRMYSILQGENPDKYRTEDFRLFKNGSLWRPPPLNPYVEGLAETDSEDELPLHKSATKVEEVKEVEPEKNKSEMDEDDRDILEDVLRNLLPRQKIIGEAMVFCLEHSEWAEEIVECISESLSILETPLNKKVARIYLISDILHNSSAKVAKASFFRKHFETKLEQVMHHLHTCHMMISSRLRAEQFKQKILACLRAWEDWAIYPDKFLICLQNTFLGLVGAANRKTEETVNEKVKVEESAEVDEEVDGLPITDECLDGVPTSANDPNSNLDVDGDPLDGDALDGVPLDVEMNKSQVDAEKERPRFVQSKWETVDPEDVESQAMTTSKWDLLEPQNVDGDEIEEEVVEEEMIVEAVASPKEEEAPADESKMSNEYDADKRARLREIEVKVMKFQDELESGQRERNPQLSISHQVNQYRTKLLDRVNQKEQEKDVKKSKSSSRSSDKRKDKRHDKSSATEDDEENAERLKKKHRKKAKDSSPVNRGLVTYDSEASSDTSSKKRTSSSKRKKSSRLRSRSRSRDRVRSRRSPYRPGKRISKSPKRSMKRSRSRSRDRKKRRKNKH